MSCRNLIVFVGLLTLVARPAAHAWTFQSWWPDGKNIVMDDVLLPPEVWSDPAQLQMVEWNEVDTIDNSHPFAINVDPEMSFGSDDGDNTIGFLGGAALMSEYSLSYANALAWAACWSSGSEIVECDVMLDPTLPWNLGPDDSTWFQSTVLHELGHVRGLNHFNSFLSMQNSGTSKFLRDETLYMDDKDGVRQNATHIPEADMVMYNKWHDGALPQWMSFSPQEAHEGETVTIQNITVENRGTLPFGSPVGFGIYLSPDDVITTSDELLSSGSFGSFATFTFSTFDWSVQVPPVQDCTTRYLGGIIDHQDAWSERYEDNNAAVFTNGPVYDANGSFAPTPLTLLLAEDYLEPNDTIGTAVVVPLPYVSDDLNLDEDTDEDWFGLDVPQSGQLDLRVLFSHDRGDIDVEITNGASTVIASSTSQSDDEELSLHLTDTAYFIRIFGQQVGSCNRYVMELDFAPDLPDLAPTVFAVPSWAAPGDTLQVPTEVENLGALDSGAFDVEVYAATDDACSPADVLAGSRSIANLEPGEASAATMSVTIPASLPLGTRYLCLIADPAGVVAESDEGNNRRLGSLSIVDPIFWDGFESGNTGMWSASVP